MQRGIFLHNAWCRIPHQVVTGKNIRPNTVAPHPTGAVVFVHTNEIVLSDTARYATICMQFINKSLKSNLRRRSYCIVCSYVRFCNRRNIPIFQRSEMKFVDTEVRMIHSDFSWPFLTASCSGVNPFLSFILWSASYSLIKYCTTKCLSRRAARCSGAFVTTVVYTRIIPYSCYHNN